MRCCACCRMPAPFAGVYSSEIHGIGVIFCLCARCELANLRLPAGTRQKRLNSAADLAARDTSGRFWSARFPDLGAADLAARMLGHPDTAPETVAALGWK